VSVATCWEIAIKAGLKKLNLREAAHTLLDRELRSNNFELLAHYAGTRNERRELATSSS